ncbi:MAG: hypothetical protein KL840_09700 [Aquamicrobium sp.]|nr:hypothetical protein [Aquamicrobium sp.]
MTEGSGELELDLGPRKNVDGSVLKLLVPMHADNFALALAAGYVGGSLKVDAAQDLQTHAGDGLIGFRGEVPSWAILEGEPGDRVLLCIEQNGEEVSKPGRMETLDGPLRVTSFQAAYFKDEASLVNFNASYDAFPDVAIGIVKCRTNWPVYAENDRPEGMQIERIGVPNRRQDLDFHGGFGAGVVELLTQGTFDEAIRKFLQTPGSDLSGTARNLLMSLEPRSSQVDIAIWCATTEALRARFGKRGFDRRDFLHDVEDRLVSRGEEVDSWIRGCQKVIDAEIDIPSLADGEKIGRRAALAIILSHEPSGLEELESNLEAGPHVRALVTTSVYAFSGLARIDEALKSPASRMDAVLDIGECVAAGVPVQIDIETLRTANDLTRHQAVKVAGNAVLHRETEPPAYMVMLKARIQEAGYKVEVDGSSGKIGLRRGVATGEFIMVEDCPRSTPGDPIINLVLPITVLGARPSLASLKKLMAAAWKHATTVALREVGENEEVVAMASLPLATLDRDELNFHVERLLQVSAELSGHTRSGRRIRKPEYKSLGIKPDRGR